MKSQKSILVLVALIGLGVCVASFLIPFLEPGRWIAGLLGVAALSILPGNRTIRAAVATCVLALLVFFVVQLIQLTAIGRQNIDLTEEQRYTLTDGTKAILKELEEPVTVNFYATRDLRSIPAALKRYIPRVDSLLSEFESLAKDGNLTVNYIDPKPNTDEEDAAELDQIQRIPVSTEEDLFFGVSVQAWDKKTTIPYFNPENETQLEFDLISAIAEVSRLEKPIVGLVTPLNMATGGQSRQGWIFYQFLTRQYNVADLGMEVTGNLDTLYSDNEWGENPGFLDPEKVPVVLVVHPAGITDSAEFALDQYLLRGGTVVAAVDGFSYAASTMGQSNPMMPGMPPQGGPATNSSLPKLFEKHGITFSGQEVLADQKFGQSNNPAVLSLDQSAVQETGMIVMNQINDIFMVFPGAFTRVETMNLEVARLLKSSLKSDLIASSEANDPRAAENLRFKLRSSNQQYDLALSLRGEFTTAFPDGDPANPSPPAEEKQEKQASTPEAEPKPESGAGANLAATEAEPNPEEEKEEKSNTLTEATSTGTLFLLADSDMLFDGAAYRLLRIGGMQGGGIPQQITDNAPLFFNILDQATNSQHLVGARARTPSFRPFTVFQEMKAEFREKAGEEIEALRAKEKAANDRILALQAERKDRQSPFLNEEQAAEVKALREESVQYAKNIREREKEYQSQEDAIKSGIFWKALLIVPALVILFGLIVWAIRRAYTKAR